VKRPIYVRDMQSLVKAAVGNFSVDRRDSLGGLVISLTILRPNGLAPQDDFVTLDHFLAAHQDIVFPFSQSEFDRPALLAAQRIADQAQRG
jgi:hypothetical protein